METIQVMAITSVALVVPATVWAVTRLIGYISRGWVSYIFQSVRARIIGLPERKTVWGIVYDSDTKRPIPFAKIELVDQNNRVLETRIADQEGRYGFLTYPESIIVQRDRAIRLRPSSPGYGFPSVVTPTVDRYVYGNLYYGDCLNVSQDRLVNFDIPMDPLRKTSRPLIMKSPSVAVGALIAALADTGFWLGLFLVPFNALLFPSPFSFGALFLYLGTASLRIWGITERPYGVVVDKWTNQPIPFALITLDDATGKRVAHTVSDDRGRYVLPVARGAYILTVHTPAPVRPSRHMRERIAARRGWITRVLRL